MRQGWPILIGAIAVLGICGIAAACPSCKDSIAATDSAGTPGIAGAFNSSIYVMLGGFLGAIGLVARVIIKGMRGS